MFKNKIINERKGAFKDMFAEIGGLNPNLGSYSTECSERLFPYAPFNASLSMAFSGVPFLKATNDN
jgi:hypothetical protein